MNAFYTLVNQTGKHNKVYHIEAAGMTVTVRWGRIGRTLSSLTRSFESVGTARAFVVHTLDARYAHGYSRA